MPPAADAPAPSCPPRSPYLARLVLLVAVALGAAGLVQTGSSAPLLVTAAAQSSSVPEPVVLHGSAVVTPPRVAPRATRSRARVARRAVLAPRWVRPSSAGVVSPFGHRWGRMHKGVDFGAHSGAPIRAIGDGVVIGAGYLGEESGYGQITLIRHAGGWVSAYAHQSRMLVHAGQRVSAGELIGYVGSTGHVTGPHLHFEIRSAVHGGQVNPVSWLRKHGVRI